MCFYRLASRRSVEEKPKLASASYGCPAAPALHAKLLVNLSQVELDSAHTQVHPSCNLFVAQACREQAKAGLFLRG